MKRVSQPSMKEGLGTGELGAPSGDKGQWGLGFLLSTQHLALSTFKSDGRRKTNDLHPSSLRPRSVQAS
ncbi:MAG: hypothetical protein KME59_09690 [Trichormus sp. ATA11-4-KO1]|jgi:hypothetical protein|nr:hypothetical protein [Trichormus sp. ATA11-4-KO1]